MGLFRRFHPLTCEPLMEAVAMQKKDNMKNSCKPWVDNGIAGMFRK